MKGQNRQNRQSKADPSARPAHERLYFFPLLLVAIFAVLFAKSFLPNFVHFSNDGPLGEVNAEYERVTPLRTGVLTGVWSNLNDIGTSGGAMAPDITALISGILGPVGYSKFFQPLCLIILGLGAWTFFRSLKLSPLAAALGGLAAALNGSYFGNACWGTASAQIAMGMTFLAMGLFMSNTNETPPLIRWSRIALAGMAVGMSVMEGFDNGAIFSLFVAAFVFFKSIFEDSAPALTKVGRGVGRVAVIAIFAAFIAAQTITSLVGTFIVGTAGMDQSNGAPDSLQHWDWATQWSLPKKETLGVFVPGLFGYRMDTPKDMMEPLQNHYVGGQYWGGMGRAPELDRFLDSGKSGPAPNGPQDWWRFGYGGYYCGILVALVAFFAMAQSLRRSNSIYPLHQRRLIWFWAVAMVIALLVSWGRFGPFDGWPFSWLYHLPGASFIRNPAKLMAVFNLAMIINFAFGIDGLCRQYMQEQTGKLKSWWAGITGFDRKWTWWSLAAFALSVFACLIYWSQKEHLVTYLQKVGFPDADGAEQIASFSIGQAGWFLLFFAAAVILVILIIAGVFSGNRTRAKVGGVLLGVLLVVDLGRANLPWIIHWDYKQKYEVDPSDSAKSSNPIVNLLIEKPFEHRVVSVQSDSSFDGLYRIEWMQQQFPFYNIQCLDVIQSPRVASDLAAYDMALAPGPSTLYHLRRKWELSNTSYVLDPAPYVDMLNQQLDPVQHRFHIVQRFQIVPKPGIDNPTEWEQVTARPDTNGDYALIQFTGALSRAKLYTNWQVSTNSEAALQTLAAQDFDPQKTVVVSAPLPAPANNASEKDAGNVEIKSYHPKDIVLAAEASAPSVLLLNDKYDPNWRVLVDGKPAELLRGNYIMRAVFLPAGSHIVEFKFSLPHIPLYVSVTFVFIGIALCGVLFFGTRNQPKTVPTNQRQLIAVN